MFLKKFGQLNFSVHFEQHAELFALQERYQKSKTVAGIRSHHCFKPISSTLLNMKRTSLDNADFTTVCMGETNGIESMWQDCQPGNTLPAYMMQIGM